MTPRSRRRPGAYGRPQPRARQPHRRRPHRRRPHRRQSPRAARGEGA